MKIQNQTAVPILCTMDDSLAIRIEPGGQGVIQTESTEGQLRVEHLYTSRVGKMFKNRKMRVIVLTTTASLSELTDDAVCYITGEVVQISGYYCYDRFYCRCEHCQLKQQKLQATQSPDFLKKANKDDFSLWFRIVQFFIEGSFVTSTCAFFLVKVGFWSSDKPFSWWWLLAFWLAAYLIMVFNEKMVDVIGGGFWSIFHIKEPLNYELEQCLSEEFIAQYFGNSRRKWKRRKPL